MHLDTAQKHKRKSGTRKYRVHRGTFYSNTFSTDSDFSADLLNGNFKKILPGADEALLFYLLIFIVKGNFFTKEESVIIHFAFYGLRRPMIRVDYIFLRIA